MNVLITSDEGVNPLYMSTICTVLRNDSKGRPDKLKLYHHGDKEIGSSYIDVNQYYILKEVPI